MNKRGDKLISVYWFVVLFIVAGGVVYMAIVFYGTPYDVREIEANLLINKIADCVATGGKLHDNIWSDLNENNIFERCYLTFDVEDEFGWEDNQYFVILSEGDLKNNFIEKVSVGNLILEDNCGNKAGTKFAFCVERSFYVSDDKVIKIKSVVGKVKKNA